VIGGTSILAVLERLQTIRSVSQTGKQTLRGATVLGLTWIYARTADAQWKE